MSMRYYHKQALSALLVLSLTTLGCDSRTETEDIPVEQISTIDDEAVSITIADETESMPITEKAASQTETDKSVSVTTKDETSYLDTDDASSITETNTLPADSIVDYIRLNMPRTDGSTSTIPLDIAVRAAICEPSEDTVQSVSHTTTYTSLENLVRGMCDVIFIPSLSEEQIEYLVENNFDYEAQPVAGEGFVFVVNRDNPVDSLTEEQLRGIYSGEITNWSEVGGDDVEIIAYQRNLDSGSQNYMRAFMGDTPLMEPLTEQVPSSMYSILDVVANYENSVGAIGYSVYSYSDGMYEDLAKIKYIKVDGVEPSYENLYDGSYPLLGYNYAVFSAELDADSPVRALVDWMRSDDGQAVIAAAGYVPYRSVEGLVLPEPSAVKLYSAVGTGRGTVSDADYCYYVEYYNDEIPVFASNELNALVAAFVDDANAELDKISDEELEQFAETRGQGTYKPVRFTRCQLENGYLSVIVGYRYSLGFELSPQFYYKVYTAVFDIYTNERLELCDLFPDGYDFVPELNHELAEQAADLFKNYYDMIREFNGLVDGSFAFTHNSIFISAGDVFADGVELDLSNLRDRMLTSNPRDMNGLLAGDGSDIRVRFNTYSGKQLKTYTYHDSGEPEILSLWLLDTVELSDEVRGKLNAFACELCESKLTDENFLRLIDAAGINRSALKWYVLQPYPDVSFLVVGNRYVTLSGPSQIDAVVDSGSPDGSEQIYLDIFDYERSNPYWFSFYFNTETGEPLRVCDLFSEGWQDAAMVHEDVVSYDESAEGLMTKPLGEVFETAELSELQITAVSGYNNTRIYAADEYARIDVCDTDGETYSIFVPVRFIPV